jgi:hypothetical protein
MADPLYELKNVATKTFFTDLSARKDEYVSVLEVIYDDNFTNRDKKFTKYCRLLNQNFSKYPSEIILPFNGNFIIECYDIREEVTLEQIQEEVLTILDEKKAHLYLKYIISNIHQIVSKLEALKLDDHLEPYRETIIARLYVCIQHLHKTYLQMEPDTSGQARKIKWLGNTNVLATLIYDLWKGQDKGKGTSSTKPLLEAQKKDLENLLINNFIDSKGNPLTLATISDYLNSSKPEKRAKKGVRIEL